jgi:hypothetical protein
MGRFATSSRGVVSFFLSASVCLCDSCKLFGAESEQACSLRVVGDGATAADGPGGGAMRIWRLNEANSHRIEQDLMKHFNLALSKVSLYLVEYRCISI